MPSYLRWYQPGGTYFFTVVTYRRWPLFEQPSARALLGEVLRETSASMPFQTIAVVLLRDHLHCVWALPRGDDDYSRRWKLIKGRFSEGWLDVGGREQRVTNRQAVRGYRGIWQRRFWEHLVRDEDDLERCCDYIHYNPVKHGYTTRPADWPWSSFHRFVRENHYHPDWGRTRPTNLVDLNWE